VTVRRELDPLSGTEATTQSEVDLQPPRAETKTWRERDLWPGEEATMLLLPCAVYVAAHGGPLTVDPTSWESPS
jgi:hypothetical protein